VYAPSGAAFATTALAKATLLENRIRRLFRTLKSYTD
jgi:hypothetical protein